MRRIINHPTFKIIAFLASFLISAIFTYHGFINVMPVITHEGRGLLTQLPTILISFTPLYLVVMYYLYSETYNICIKWRIKLITSVSVISVITLSLISHILFICLNKYSYGTQNLLYPFDMVVLGGILLVLGILLLIEVLLHKDEKDVPVTSPYHVRTRQKVAVIAVICFANYFLGDFYSVINYFEYLDPNWFGMIPFILSLLLPALAFANYLIYKIVPEINKKKLLIISGAIFVALVIWSIIALIINPVLLSESLSNFYMLGFCVKIPFGALITLLVFTIPYVFSLVKTIKNK